MCSITRVFLYITYIIIVIILSIDILDTVDCGHPATRLDLNLTSTTYNSTVSYICETGVLPPAADYSVCTGSGEWEPDPSTVQCKEKGGVILTVSDVEIMEIKIFRSTELGGVTKQAISHT